MARVAGEILYCERPMLLETVGTTARGNPVGQSKGFGSDRHLAGHL